MNRLVILVFAACVIYSVEGSLDKLLKIKREASLSSRLLQDSITNVHTRERRSSKSSYVFFDNRSGRTVQLWWRGEKWQKFSQLSPGGTVQINTFVSDKWRATDVKTNEIFVINDKKKYRPKANTKDTRDVCIIKRRGQKETDIKAFIETLIVVDKTVRDRFDNDSEVERYVEVLFKLASNAYNHKSLTQHGLKIDIVPSKISILQHEVKLDPSKKGDNVYTACEVMNKKENTIGSKRFDHKLFLTRNQFGAAGYSRSSAMCSRYSSCSIVFDHGFHAAYLVAHEIAHSLGLSHGDFPQFSRYIMSGFVDALFDSHRWSTKSQQTLLSNTRKYDCLGNNASVANKYPYPGEHFSFQKQCDLEFNNTYTAWKPSRWQPGDPCEKLRCKMPGRWSFLTRTTGSPALDGTECGDNKFCLLGKCQDKPAEKTAPVTQKHR